MEDDEASEERSPGGEPWEGTTRELAVALRRLSQRLRDETTETLPRGEPFLESPSPAKRRLKARLFRSIRPATRRYDRLAGDLATVASDLATRLAVLEERTTAGLERLELELSRVVPRTSAEGPPGAAAVPDEYYWAFEERMRGSTESIRHRLTTYEDLAREHLADVRAEGAEYRRWLDLGCGNGEFCDLLRGWGWDVEGVDGSPAAVETCRERGIGVTLSDVLDHLQTRPVGPLGGISAIQLIEHLPRERWVAFFEGMFRALSPGGALLLETINGRNVQAVANHFHADVTHTWPGHPETLRMMAEHVGFSDVQVRFENEDPGGAAEDVTIWARKPRATASATG
jgi:SAM-dependent methyltransferase